MSEEKIDRLVQKMLEQSEKIEKLTQRSQKNEERTEQMIVLLKRIEQHLN